MLKDFLATITNKSTYYSKMAFLKDYFRELYGSPDEDTLDAYDLLAKRYIEEVRGGRDYFDDIMKYIPKLSERMAPRSVDQGVIAVRVFLSRHKLYFEKEEADQIRNSLPKGKRALGEEDDFELEDIARILQHCDLKMRALILVLASSGMRIGETLNLQLDDIRLDEDPVMVHIPGTITKTGDTRDTFISQEAKEAVVEWLSVREAYIVSALNKNRGLIEANHSGAKVAKDDRVFPFSTSVVQFAWETALEKTGLLRIDRTTHRKTRRPHSLRKYFRTRMALAIPVDIVEALMGHGEYLTMVYRRYSKKELASFYKKGEQMITIQRSDVSREVEEMKHDSKVLESRLMDQVLDLKMENAELRKKVGDHSEIEALKVQMADLANIVNKIRFDYGADERLDYKESYRELVGLPPVDEEN